jgi:hypothetical protein
MKLDNPLIIQDQQWDYITTNLAITSKYDQLGNMDACVAARFIPTRIDENGEIKTLDTEAITLFRGSLSELKDTHEMKAMIAIKTALEELILSKVSN